jgi:hypothetical protein
VHSNVIAGKSPGINPSFTITITPLTLVEPLWSDISNCGAPSEGVVGPMGGARYFYVGRYYFKRKWTQDKMFILVGTLLG